MGKRHNGRGFGNQNQNDNRYQNQPRNRDENQNFNINNNNHNNNNNRIGKNNHNQFQNRNNHDIGKRNRNNNHENGNRNHNKHNRKFNNQNKFKKNSYFQNMDWESTPNNAPKQSGRQERPLQRLNNERLTAMLQDAHAQQQHVKPGVECSYCRQVGHTIQGCGEHVIQYLCNEEGMPLSGEHVERVLSMWQEAKANTANAVSQSSRGDVEMTDAAPSVQNNDQMAIIYELAATNPSRPYWETAYTRGNTANFYQHLHNHIMHSANLTPDDAWMLLEHHDFSTYACERQLHDKVREYTHEAYQYAEQLMQGQYQVSIDVVFGMTFQALKDTQWNTNEFVTLMKSRIQDEARKVSVPTWMSAKDEARLKEQRLFPDLNESTKTTPSCDVIEAVVKDILEQERERHGPMPIGSKKHRRQVAELGEKFCTSKETAEVICMFL